MVLHKTSLDSIKQLIDNHYENGNSKTDTIIDISYILFPHQSIVYNDIELKIAEYVYNELK